MGNLLLSSMDPQSINVYLLLSLDKRPRRVPNPCHGRFWLDYYIFRGCTDEFTIELQSFHPMVADLPRPRRFLPRSHLTQSDMDRSFFQPHHRLLPHHDPHANALEGRYALASKGRSHHAL